MRPPLLRSYLYVPATDPAMMRKALATSADAVVVDLEDAVPTSERGRAREHVATLLREEHRGGAPQIHVRINRDGDGYDREEIEAIVCSGLDAIRLPKAESRAAIEDVAAFLEECEDRSGIATGHVGIYPTVESAVGATRVEELAAASRVVRLGYGAADLLADLGIIGRGDEVIAFLRGELVLRSRAAGIGLPIDTVFTDLDDEEGLRLAAERARNAGMWGKSVIHPRQLEPVHAAFTPTEREVSKALRIMDVVAEAGDDPGGIVVDGEFVDRPVIGRARAIVDLWDAVHGDG